MPRLGFFLGAACWSARSGVCHVCIGSRAAFPVPVGAAFQALALAMSSILRFTFFSSSSQGTARLIRRILTSAATGTFRGIIFFQPCRYIQAKYSNLTHQSCNLITEKSSTVGPTAHAPRTADDIAKNYTHPEEASGIKTTEQTPKKKMKNWRMKMYRCRIDGWEIKTAYEGESEGTIKRGVKRPGI